MADYSTNREYKKDRLKRQVIPDRSDEGESRSGFSPKALIALLFGILVMAAGAFFVSQQSFATSFTVLWEKALETGGSGRAETFKGYESFAKGVIRYSRDGAAYIDHEGKTIWERSYQMNAPIAAVCENYAVIADQGGSSLYIFSDSVNTGVSTAHLPITEVEISANGTVYAKLKDDKAEYITAFRSDGTAIDLSVKSIITGDGYPLDIAVSPDGSQLLTSYIAIENGLAVNKVIFRNFDEVGKNTDARRIVGGFTDEFAGHTVAKVYFASDTYSQAFYDGGAVFFSTKVLTSPEVIKHIKYENRMLSIACSGAYTAIISENPAGSEAAYHLDIYKASGAKSGEADFDFSYTGFSIENKQIILHNENEIMIFDAKGRQKAELMLDGMQIAKVIKAPVPGEYVVIGSNQMQKIRI